MPVPVPVPVPVAVTVPVPVAVPVPVPVPVRRRPLVRQPLVCAMVVAGILGLTSGCAVGPIDLNSQTADRLQALVVDVATHAAANDYAGAVKTLDDLQKRLDNAAARGDVSYARHLQIQRSIELVRADLLARIPAPVQSTTPRPAPAPSPSSSPERGATPSPDPTPSSSPERGATPTPSTNGSNQQGRDNSKKPEDPGKGDGGGNNK